MFELSEDDYEPQKPAPDSFPVQTALYPHFPYSLENSLLSQAASLHHQKICLLVSSWPTGWELSSSSVRENSE